MEESPRPGTWEGAGGFHVLPGNASLHPGHLRMVRILEAPCTLSSLSFCGGLIVWARPMTSLLPSPVPLCSGRWRRGAGRSVLWGLADSSGHQPHSGPHGSSPSVASLGSTPGESRALSRSVSGVFFIWEVNHNALRNSALGTEIKEQILQQKPLLASLFQSVKNAISGASGRGHTCISGCITVSQKHPSIEGMDEREETQEPSWVCSLWLNTDGNKKKKSSSQEF